MTCDMPKRPWRLLVALVAFGHAFYLSTTLPFVGDRLDVPFRAVGWIALSIAVGVFIGATWPRRYWEVTVRFPRFVYDDGDDADKVGSLALFFDEKKANAAADKLNADIAVEITTEAERPVYAVREIFKRFTFEPTP